MFELWPVFMHSTLQKKIYELVVVNEHGKIGWNVSTIIFCVASMYMYFLSCAMLRIFFAIVSKNRSWERKKGVPAGILGWCVFRIGLKWKIKKAFGRNSLVYQFVGEWKQDIFWLSPFQVFFCFHHFRFFKVWKCFHEKTQVIW